MKNKYACAIAALALAALLTAVALNILYVDTTFDTIEELLGDMSDTVRIEEARDYWEKRRAVMEISLSEPELDKISLLLDEMLINAEEGDEAELKRTAARFRRAADDIRELEDFSLDNIF